MGSIRDKLGVLVKSTLGVLIWLWLPLLSSLDEDLLRDVQINNSLDRIDSDFITITDMGNWASNLSLRDNMSNQEAVGATRETAVSEESTVVSETSTHDDGGGLEHLDHSWGTLGTLVADDDDGLFTLLDGSVGDFLGKVFFTVEHTGLTLKGETLLAGDFTDGAAGGERATEDLDVAGFLDGVGEGTDDFLVGGEGLGLFEVLGHGLAGDGLDGAVDEALLEEEFEEGGGAADLVDVGHDVLSGGLKVGEERDAVGDGLEVVDGELDTDGVGHGNQMEDGVGGTAGDVDEDHGVLESGTGHDVGGLNVLLQKDLDGLSGLKTLTSLCGAVCWVGRRAWERHTEGLDSGCHGVCRVHTTTGTWARAGIADDVVAFLLCDLTSNVGTVGLESCISSV